MCCVKHSVIDAEDIVMSRKYQRCKLAYQTFNSNQLAHDITWREYYDYGRGSHMLSASSWPRRLGWALNRGEILTMEKEPGILCTLTHVLIRRLPPAMAVGDHEYVVGSNGNSSSWQTGPTDYSIGQSFSHWWPLLYPGECQRVSIVNHSVGVKAKEVDICTDSRVIIRRSLR